MPTGHYKRSQRVERVILNCKVCGREIKLTHRAINSRPSPPKFCSQKCHGISRINPDSRITVPCDHCGKEFSKRKTHVRTRNYCSKDCLSLSKRLDGSKWRDPIYIKKYMREYSEKNRKKLNATSKRWSLNNLQKRHEIQKRYGKNNREKIIALAHYRRRPSLGRISPEFIKKMMSSAGGICQYCGKKCEKLTVDHVIPIIHGGDNDVTNLIPCCRSCNSSKNAKPPEDWLYEKHGLAGLASAIWFLEHGEGMPCQMRKMVEAAYDITVDIVR